MRPGPPASAGITGDEMEYQINISIEPYTGQLRQVGNVFSFEQAEIVAELLGKKREKYCFEIIKLTTTAKGREERG